MGPPDAAGSGGARPALLPRPALSLLLWCWEPDARYSSSTVSQSSMSAPDMEAIANASAFCAMCKCTGPELWVHAPSHAHIKKILRQLLLQSPTTPNAGKHCFVVPSPELQYAKPYICFQNVTNSRMYHCLDKLDILWAPGNLQEQFHHPGLC